MGELKWVGGWCEKAWANSWQIRNCGVVSNGGGRRWWPACFQNRLLLPFHAACDTDDDDHRWPVCNDNHSGYADPVKWSASLVKNAQFSSLQQGVTLLCLIGKAGWWVGGWDIGIGRGGIATGIAKQSTSIGSPVLCCCISPWGRRQIENVRNIRTFTLSFSSSLLWEGFRKNVKHCFSILWANSTSIPNWKFQNCPQY